MLILCHFIYRTVDFNRQVHSLPRVAVLSTGDELAPSAAAQLARGQIRDANRPMLLAAGALLSQRPRIRRGIGLGVALSVRDTVWRK